MSVALLSLDTTTGNIAVYVRSLRGGLKVNERFQFEDWQTVRNTITPAQLDQFRRLHSKPDYIPLNPNDGQPGGTPAAMRVAA